MRSTCFLLKYLYIYQALQRYIYFISIHKKTFIFYKKIRYYKNMMTNWKYIKHNYLIFNKIQLVKLLYKNL